MEVKPLIWGKTRRVCDNAGRYGLGISLTPQCWDNEAKVLVELKYHKFESDILELCEECFKRLKKEFRRYGYKVRKIRNL